MSRTQSIRIFSAVLWALLGYANFVAAQQQPWLWNYPRAQPFFDLPWQRRFDMCEGIPTPWQCEPEGNGQSPGSCQGGGDDCDSCKSDTDDPCPYWMARRKCGFYVTADFAPMFYDYNTFGGFARLGPNGPLALTTRDIPTEFDSGGRFQMGFQLTCRTAIEGSYQGYYNYAANGAYRDVTPNAAQGIGNLQSPFSNFGNPAVAGFDNNSAVAIGIRNNFSTADLNFRYLIDMQPGPFEVSFLVGARFARVNELFRYQSQTNTPTIAAVSQDVGVSTGNEMWGAQIGFITHTLVNERFWVDFTGKAAILNNDTFQQTTLVTTTNGNALTTTGLAGANRTAFLLDGSLLGNYQLTRRFSVHAGYQAIWIDGLALGVANFETNRAQLLGGPAQLDHGTAAVYHGPVMGLTWQR